MALCLELRDRRDDRTGEWNVDIRRRQKLKDAVGEYPSED
jgi:hypothetical protein